MWQKQKTNTNWLRIGASYPHEKDPSSTRTAADVESSSLYISFILRTFAEQIVFTSLFDGDTKPCNVSGTLKVTLKTACLDPCKIGIR